MRMQDVAWMWMLAGVGLVSLVFLYVVAQAGRPADAKQVQSRAYAIRRWWFALLILLGVGVAYASLRPFPIADQHAPAQGAQIVSATARQWSWVLSPDRVKAGAPVEFDVTSVDVNHGFALYGPDQRIVTQTQAMPGFTNKILYTFRTPGTYRIMCLEYCGVAHNGMTAEFDVAAREDKS